MTCIRFTKLPISEEDVIVIREHLSDSDLAYQALFELSINVPIQVAELLKMLVKDFAEFEEGKIQMKHSAEIKKITITFPDELVAIMNEYLSMRFKNWIEIGKKKETFLYSGLFVTIKGDWSITMEAFTKMFYRLREECNLVNDYGTDSFRKTYALRLIRNDNGRTACRLFRKTLPQLKGFLGIETE